MRRSLAKITSAVFSLAAIALTLSVFAAESKADTRVSSLDFANGLYARGMYAPAVEEYQKFIEANPASPETSSARFRAASAQYFLKKYQAASQAFEAFIKDYPDDKRVHSAQFQIAVAQYHMERFERAVDLLLKLSNYEPDPAIRAGALFYLAKCYDASQEEAKSIEALQKLTTDHPDSEYAVYGALFLGDRLRRDGKKPEALKAYEFAAGRSEPKPVVREARFKAAEISLEEKDFAGAAGLYRKIRESGAEESYRDQALLGLFYCDYGAGDRARAQKRVEEEKTSVEAGASGPEILYLTALLSSEAGDDEAALKLLEAVFTHPKITEAILDKALFKKSALLAKSGKNEEALSVLETVLEAGSPRAPEANYEKGLILKSMNRLPEALVAFEAARADGSSVHAKEALFESALLYASQGESDKAREILNALTEKFPQEKIAQRAYLELSQIEIEAKNFEKAAAYAEKFVSTYPESEWIDIGHYKRGVALFGEKKYPEAAAAFKNVADKKVGSKLRAESIYGAGSSLESDGLVKDSIGYYERLLKEYPDHALSREILERLGSIYMMAGDTEKASLFYENAVLGNSKVSVKPEEVYWLVQFLLDREQYDRMKKVLEAAERLFPGEGQAHEIAFYKGECAMGLGDFKGAIEHYAGSIRKKADGAFVPHAYLGSGIAYAALNDSVNAEKNFNEALHFDNELKVAARARFEIASLRLRQGDIPEAAKAFMLVAILYDDAKYTPLSLFKAAECFKNLNQPENAEKAVLELKERYPDSEWAKKV